MMNRGIINASEVRNIFFFVDEHTTATDGRYELQEGLLQELKEGTINFAYNTFFKPILPSMNMLTVSFCNSKKNTLVRAADIIANRIYHEVVSGNDPHIRSNLYIKHLP